LRVVGGKQASKQATDDDKSCLRSFSARHVHLNVLRSRWQGEKLKAHNAKHTQHKIQQASNMNIEHNECRAGGRKN